MLVKNQKMFLLLLLKFHVSVVTVCVLFVSIVLCSVFAGVAEPDDSDSEPVPNGMPQLDDDSNSEPMVYMF